MKKVLFILACIFINLEGQAQVFSLDNMPASGVILRKEGGSTINIDIKNTMAMGHTMSVKFSLTGKNMNAMVNTDLEQFSNSLLYDTIQFPNNGITRRFSFKPTYDGFAEGNDTFIFKISQPSMGTIGTPDSVFIVITDSLTAPITGRPVYDIGKIRGTNKDGMPDSFGKSCSIRGTIYGMNRLKVGYRMFICDGTGCIGIYSNKTYSLLPITDLNEGDSVEISGVIAHFNGLGQINFNSTGDTIRKLGLGKFQQPVTVTKLNESTESRLVRIENLELVVGKWVTTTDSTFNLRMRNPNNDTFTVRIENDPKTNFGVIDTIKTGVKYTITGMGSQFDNSSNPPFTKGFQILPRKLSDIVKFAAGGGGGSNIAAAALLDFTVFPTLVTNSIHVYLDASINESGSIQVIDLLGKVVREDKIKLNLGENIFQLNQLDILPQGNYILNIQTPNNQLHKQFSIVK